MYKKTDTVKTTVIVCDRGFHSLGETSMRHSYATSISTAHGNHKICKISLCPSLLDRRSHRYRRHHHNQHREHRSHRRHGGEAHRARGDAHSYY